LGFVPSFMDTSLFIYQNGDDIAYILLYVDDIIFFSSTLLIDCIVSSL
jgi:hypothetical protein